MAEQEETYCRLCAEPTPKDQLIYADEDVAINSKIATKMLWINIDISNANTLPTTICFSCFDLLERTWSFLHTVRSAQEKLTSIFLPKVSKETDDTSSDVKTENKSSAGKPVDKNWQEFQATKTEDPAIKIDPENLEVVGTVDPNTLIDNITVKAEQVSDNDYHVNDSDGFNTTDSDIPLLRSVKKRKVKKKKRIKYDIEVTVDDLLKAEVDAEPLPLSSQNMTWEDYMCHCASCDAFCKNIQSLRLHSLQIHTRCCVFKCSDCGKVIANFKNFVNHVRTHKNILRYCCEYCNKQFTLTALVKKHLNTVHGNVYLTTCQNCGAAFDSEELLQDHLLLYSKGLKKSRKKDNFDECDLKCNECGKEFKSKSNLQQHKLVHTQRSRDFSCHICGKMFFTKGTLSTHMSTHEDTKPFKCEYCPMAFRARGNLQSHISLHSGAKPFVCEQCGKSFRVKRHLKSHSIVHTDLMPYVCEYCTKSFRFKTRLNLHLRQHTGAKPYNCVYCQRDFTNGSNFKKHMKRRHNVDTSKKRYNNIVVDNNQEGTESV
ncbi:gastrula zinc finger protein XlCGF26.1-like [Pectinophora gossypiella]|uniref:gastrula zinc finger protein XlCGF26.1-like n=1 Tax=Pectinophora gossypiella TaxID=13191 RepID=UPI00214E570E|nr:gastrula zinc finger protein XlCGF26.1-like [Pectinophora gossypiella]